MTPDMIQTILSFEQFQFKRRLFEYARDNLIILADDFCRKLGNEKYKSVFEMVGLFESFFCRTFSFGLASCPEWECFTLCGTIINSSGSCLGLTTLHIALGMAVGFPMRSALFEGHIVPVYMDGEIPIFIETTRRSNAMYEHSIQLLHGKPIKILSDYEFLAVQLSNRATQIYARVGLLDDAVFLLDSALELFPCYTAGWINRATIMKKLDDTKEMRRSLDIAKSLNPGIRYTRAIEQIENDKLTNN
ncbi:MAG: hypothetical protein LBC74_00880 [Planctomycetaceae bacterium]|jgi:tetratricopeptide (TPR) repeat protein|nr:hypothetical protein [Planctomycetaceae bacterium]